MLRLILGRAKSGKTAAIIGEIASHVHDKIPGNILIVPEQHSHEAETELLLHAGDAAPLYAEVLSFKRLAGRVEAETGTGGRTLDKAGRLLCMTLALDAVSPRLALYSGAKRRTGLAESLLGAVDELKSARITSEELMAGASGDDGVLGKKLRDLALITEAYDACVGAGRLDPSDRLTRLAASFSRSDFAGRHFYIDGFTDFTQQELAVIEAMLCSGSEVAVCLTSDGTAEGHEVFEASRRCAAALMKTAKSASAKCEVTVMRKSGSGGVMDFLERELFSFGDVKCGAEGAVSLAEAKSIGAECEAAAARCIRLVKGGCRWRDIAVAVRGYDSYRPVIEGIFVRYGIPLYSAGRSGISEKPLISLVRGAYDIVTSGWETEDVIEYIKTGLTALAPDDALELCEYVYLWSIRGSTFTREEPWHMHPDGYGAEFTDATRERLQRIDRLRRAVAQPLRRLEEAGKNASAKEQAEALANFFMEISLPQTLEKRAKRLDELGLRHEAAEYEQLWNIVTSALEQCAGTLGDMPLEQEDFARLLLLVLGKYDVGTIPLMLDAVSAGDMDTMRRRSIKHLLILGCDDQHVPLAPDDSGVFTDDDRQTMAERGLEIGNTALERLSHEFALIYNCVTLPSDSIYMSRSLSSGETAQPSFIMKRAERIFGEVPERVDVDRCRLMAERPAFELAAGCSEPGNKPLTMASRAYFSGRGRQSELDGISERARHERERLSRESVRRLYGDRLRLSASRIDRISSCRYAYFLQYGLKAQPRKPAAFSPPEMGTFMHYVLEAVARRVQEKGGFAAASDEEIAELCDEYIAKYAEEKLGGLRDQTARFRYLFSRLRASVIRVVLDMAEELRSSSFVPLDFELDFSREKTTVGGAELTGVADRVDGWVHDGKLYLRVVDYKTGKKKFSLSDIWYGMGLQMLLYLFTLEQVGEKRYGLPVIPAGVLYVPARDELVSMQEKPDEETLSAELARRKKRSGLILGADEVIEAMEHGETKRFIPVTIKKGTYTGQALATAEQLGMLSRHIESIIKSMTKEIGGGSIELDPYYRSQTDTACRLCDYSGSCGFDEARDCRRYLESLTPAEVWSRIEEEQSDGI